MSNNIYYVYAYLRSEDSEIANKFSPYYIGYGKHQRAYNKHRISVPKDKQFIVFIKQNLSVIEAKELEIELIKTYGRVDNGTGILRNLTNGGDGLVDPSKETKEKLSISKTGKIHSEETKRKISNSLRGRKSSPETKKKLSEINKLRKHSEDTKRKISEAQKDPNFKKEMSKKLRGRKWYYNPISLNEIFVFPSTAPIGFISGRKPKIPHQSNHN